MGRTLMDPWQVAASPTAEPGERASALSMCFKQDPQAAAKLAATMGANPHEHPIVRFQAIWLIVISAHADALAVSVPWRGWAPWDDLWNDPDSFPPDWQRQMIQGAWVRAAVALAMMGVLERLAVFDAAVEVAEQPSPPLDVEEVARALRDLFPPGQMPPGPLPATLSELRAWRPLVGAIRGRKPAPPSSGGGG